MADLKMPEINNIVIAGNLTKDPVYRETSSRTPVVNFHIAANRRYKDSSNRWQEDVCYVGVVAWNKLAESCRHKIKKGSAVMVDGELQSRTFKSQDSRTRTVVEIKAKRIQFLNRNGFSDSSEITEDSSSVDSNISSFKKVDIQLDDENSFDKFLSEEESDLMNDDNNSEV